MQQIASQAWPICEASSDLDSGVRWPELQELVFACRVTTRAKRCSDAARKPHNNAASRCESANSHRVIRHTCLARNLCTACRAYSSIPFLLADSLHSIIRKPQRTKRQTTGLRAYPSTIDIRGGTDHLEKELQQ